MSFTKAAVELNLTQSAVSRQIRLMEDYLGVELFQRGSQRLAVTEAGRVYAEEVRRVLHSLQESTLRLMSYQELGGVLHVATPSVFGAKWLIPRLHSFYSEHPDIVLNLLTRSEPFDLESEQLDVAIHWGNNDWPNVVAHPLVGHEMVPVCSPSYLSSIGVVERPADMAKATLLQHTRRPNRWLEWFGAHDVQAVNSWAGARFEHFHLITQATVAGLGVGLLPRIFVADEVKSGRLLMLFDDGYEGSDIYHLVYPEQRGNDPKVAKFREWILRQAAADSNQEGQG